MKRVLFLLVICLMLVSCSSEKPKTEIGLTPQQLADNFNDAAEDTDFRLNEVSETEDGTFSIDTGYDEVNVTGTLDDGKITSVEVESTGVFERTLPSYDYMIYVMMACDDTVEFDGADGFIADLFYEAYYGGDEVIAGYNGVQYAFEKTSDCFWFRIRNNE